jgi:hypothetical protein
MSSKKRKTTWNEKQVWYKFKPKFNMWFSKMSGKSYVTELQEESWYGGYPFKSGYSAFIQLRYFVVHIKLTWWEIRL